MKPEEVSGYKDAKARYDGLVTAAKADGNELEELRAERDWRNALDGFRQQAEDANAHEAALDRARAQARSEFGRAPEVIYASLSDPEAVLAAAKAAHEAIVAATPSNGAPPPQQPWPTPPQGTPTNLQPQHKFDDPNEWQKSMAELRSKPKSAAGDSNNQTLKEMREYVLDRLIAPPKR